MATSLDQALLYFVELRVRVRAAPEARAVVDRCLQLLTTARTADAETMARLEAEVDALRQDLLRRLGPAKTLKIH